MKKYSVITLLFLLFFGSCSLNPRPDPEIRILFNDDWLFHRGDFAGGEKMAADESGWQKTDLPHDWSIENIPGTLSPFDSTVFNGVSSGYTQGGTGWYRKHFHASEKEKGKRFYLLFEGIYMNSDVWVNERHVGNYFYGYSSFQYDISDFLRFGEDNVIAVRVRNDQVKCRWYSGSGIYRHVWMIHTEALHIDNWGLNITTPEVSEDRATVDVKISLTNQCPYNRKGALHISILDHDNHALVSQSKEFEVAAGKKTTVDQQFTIRKPRLWDTKSPYLYCVEAKIVSEHKVLDQSQQDFGIRSISFDARDGFKLNGQPMELKGGCIHHDNGPLGARALDRAEERKVELLKSAGFNAIRFAHNPPSPAILDACDRLGMLAIDESFDVWRYGHFEDDYGSHFDSLWRTDIDHMVLRDRNHPSVIMWSIGNEIVNSQTEEIANLCGDIAGYVRALDPTRPVTSAANSVTPEKDPYFSHLDVCGYNYSPGRYKTDHERNPERVMYGSESFAIEAYDYWKAVEDYAWVIGDFVWTAFDHIGEASIGWRGYFQEPDFYPWNLAYCGDFDITGSRRPQSFYRQTLWDSVPLVAIFVTPPVPSFPVNPKKESWSIWDWPDVIPSWNFPGCERIPLKVVVYSQCEGTELFLNGLSLGRKANSDENKNMFFWEVPYQAGQLKAKGFMGGKPVTESLLITADLPVKINLTADRSVLKADGQDLSFIQVALVDSHGVTNPVADRQIEFEITGTGKLAAVANANPTSTESFQLPRRKTWRGQCMIIVQSKKEKGDITVTAHAEGLPDNKLIVRTE